MGTVEVKDRYTQSRARRKKRGKKLIIAYAIQGAILFALVLMIVFMVRGVLYIWERLVKEPLQTSESDNVGYDISNNTENPEENWYSGIEPVEPAISFAPVVLTPPIYEFGTPLEESDAVNDEWFDNTVFLGDSRTEGLQLFSGLTHGDFLWTRGMSVFHADDNDYRLFTVDGKQVTLIGALSGKSYEAVYVMLGINDLGYNAAAYESALAILIDKIIAAQPNAVVYLQTLPPVNDAVVQQNGLSSYNNNSNVNQFNEAIARIAEEKQVVLLDTASAYRGSDGQLPADMTIDGVHFAYDGYVKWADFLRCHTIESERYFYSRES